MAELTVTMAGLLWMALGVIFAVRMRAYKKQFDKILQELEDEMNGGLF